jgi:hypothetical protein
MNRKFRPSLNALESRNLLSTLHPHQAPKVHANAETVTPTPPHQAKRPGHTGTLIAGEMACRTSDNAQTGSILTFGSGNLDIARRRVNGVGVVLEMTDSQHGTLTLCTGNDFIVADVVTLEDGSAGNYTITCATGDYRGVIGTGILKVYQQADGSSTISINPHQ